MNSAQSMYEGSWAPVDQGRAVNHFAEIFSDSDSSLAEVGKEGGRARAFLFRQNYR